MVYGTIITLSQFLYRALSVATVEKEKCGAIRALNFIDPMGTSSMLYI